VYDYNRRDKDGNLRPLHVAKALEVSNLQKSPDLPATPDGEDILLAACEYFEVRRLRVDGTTAVTADETSFVSLMATDGAGVLSFDGGEIPFEKGDSLFIPAQNATFTVSGKCELVQSKVN
jgi:mannose-6-phosphate isomerase